jgi:hypothetical protein
MTPNPKDQQGPFKAEKQSYSRGAWRVLNAITGAQIYRNAEFDHPFMGSIRLAGPVCFDRKRDAVAWIEAESQLPAEENQDDRPQPQPCPVNNQERSNEEREMERLREITSRPGWWWQSAQFIAAARTAVPSLLARVAAVERERDALLGSFEVVQDRLTSDVLTHPEDRNRTALLHIEAVMSGQHRPFALLKSERDAALAENERHCLHFYEHDQHYAHEGPHEDRVVARGRLAPVPPRCCVGPYRSSRSPTGPSGRAGDGTDEHARPGRRARAGP